MAISIFYNIFLEHLDIITNRACLLQVMSEGSGICQQYASMAVGCDMVIGYIANDRMFVVRSCKRKN